MQHSLCHRKCSKRTGGTGQGQATDLVIRYPGLMTELGKLLRTPLLQGTKLHSPQSLGCEPSKCRGGHPRWIHTSKQPPPRALAPSKFSTLFLSTDLARWIEWHFHSATALAAASLCVHSAPHKPALPAGLVAGRPTTAQGGGGRLHTREPVLFFTAGTKSAEIGSGPGRRLCYWRRLGGYGNASRGAARPSQVGAGRSSGLAAKTGRQRAHAVQQILRHLPPLLYLGPAQPANRHVSARQRARHTRPTGYSLRSGTLNVSAASPGPGPACAPVPCVHARLQGFGFAFHCPKRTLGQSSRLSRQIL